MAALDPRLLSLPFPLRVSRFTPAVEEDVRLWAHSHGLLPSGAADERFRASRIGRYAGSVQPDAPWENLRLHAAFLAWLFLVNDQHGEGVYATADAWRAAVEPLVTVLRSGRTTGVLDPGPAARALADLLGRVYPRMSDGWRARFARHCAAMLSAVEPESRDRRAGLVPTVERYVANRRTVSGGAPLLDLCELSAPRELPPSIYRTRSHQRMRAAATDVMAWTNDIVSVEKETAAGEVHNFVVVLERHQALTRADALRAVTARVLGRVDDYLAAERALVAHVDALDPDDAFRATVEYCADSMRHFMAGHVHWCRHNPRYTGPPARVEDLLRSTPSVARRVEP